MSLEASCGSGDYLLLVDANHVLLRQGPGNRAVQQRADLGGWQEEVFYPKWQVGRPEHRPTDAAAPLLDAWVYRPTRAEPFYDLACPFTSTPESTGWRIISPRPDSS